MVWCRELEHLKNINYTVLLLSGCMSGGQAHQIPPDIHPLSNSTA